MSRIGTELFPLLFEVKRADTLGQSMYRRAEKLEYIAEYERVYRKILADHQCVSKKEMKINGSEMCIRDRRYIMSSKMNNSKMYNKAAK